MSQKPAKKTKQLQPSEVTTDDHKHVGFWGLTLGSVGVVYGDIGTSPLYAFKEALLAASGHEKQGLIAPTQSTVIGLISLILWALILIVTIKYVLILLRADNNGEGGTLALMALARKKVVRGRSFVMFLGVLGAALFYSDSMITPAISVLSAVEGIKIIAPSFEPLVLPITVGILIGLFLVQARGTASVATFFGPITAVWFLAMAAAGLYHISDDWNILWAFNPYYAIHFLLDNGKGSLLILGAIFLAVTGAEALYADLGHFGRKPIQAAWMGLVLPCLALNYLGQGALVLSNPKAIENPFFLLFPDWALVPMVILATMATVIASQAVITGAYSITRQAIQLGLLPRLEIKHTSESHQGQIYIPKINTILLLGVLLLVMMFKTSSAIAEMYGIAVTGAMMVDAFMAFIVFWKVWRWSLPMAALVILPFFAIEAVFLSANLLKVLHGGWVPLSICAYILFLVYTWRKGSRILSEKTRKAEVPLNTLLKSLESRPPHLVSGTAVFLTSDPESAPTALLHNIKHNKVLHEKNVILTIITAPTPRVDDEDRVKIENISEHFTTVSMTFGFMETPNIPKKLAICRKLGWTFDIMATSFFLSRRTLKIGTPPSMPMVQEKTFLVLVRNADNATNYFQIPTARVVEVGTQVTI